MKYYFLFLVISSLILIAEAASINTRGCNASYCHCGDGTFRCDCCPVVCAPGGRCIASDKNL
ncbi:hypothetical protein BJ944DRAFT_262260 [Cunninghamella echinulata]|nr:hypothetical protein BJ944DRAFT_262260 [Cunninghamella echinulata]